MSHISPKSVQRLLVEDENVFKYWSQRPYLNKLETRSTEANSCNGFKEEVHQKLKKFTPTTTNNDNDDDGHRVIAGVPITR